MRLRSEYVSEQSTGSPLDARRMRRLERLAWLLDNSLRVPGTRYRVGLDGIIGLVPVLGDFVGAVLSSWLIGQAAIGGAPPSLIVRMGLNVAVESIVGAIPLLGDLFDFAFKANARNVELLKSHVADPVRSRNRNRFVVAATAVLAIATIVAILALIFTVLRWLWLWMSGTL